MFQGDDAHPALYAMSVQPSMYRNGSMARTHITLQTVELRP